MTEDGDIGEGLDGLRQPAFVASRSNPLCGFAPAGFNQAYGRKWWTTSELARLRQLREGGASRAAIALALGRSVAAVKAQLERRELTLKRPLYRHCCTCGQRIGKPL